MIFDGFTGGPRAEAICPFGAIWLVPGLYCSNQTVGSSSSTCKIQHQTGRKKGIRKSQDAIHEQTKNQGCDIIAFTERGTMTQDIGNSSQPSGPSPEGPADM